MINCLFIVIGECCIHLHVYVFTCMYATGRSSIRVPSFVSRLSLRMRTQLLRVMTFKNHVYVTLEFKGHHSQYTSSKVISRNNCTHVEGEPGDEGRQS